MRSRSTTLLLIGLAAIVLLASPAAAFGAGNIASISKIEGQNWRHGDLEDLLMTVAFLRGKKWTSMMVKRAYFGNWLRDYSQAVDVGTLKGVPADTIRVLVWVLAFMSFGYATAEFEVTAERLGVYRPEEHIDNPKDYADNVDARKFDQRLRGPIERIELEIDPETGMKNYIANERGGWATSLGYVKYSFSRSIHFGRLYTHGANKGREEDLCEALRCLGQGLHCLEDFGAHTNYIELALRELGHRNVFPHVGTQTMINLHGRQVYPLTTGTFGGVDFLHSVLGEATDHVTQSEVDQSEVDQLNAALTNAQSTGGSRGFGDGSSNSSALIDLLSSVPGTGGLIQEARDLEAASDAQANENYQAESSRGNFDVSYSDYSGSRAPGQSQAGPASGLPGGININIDPQAAIAKIYPLLAFRDKVVRSIASLVANIPGLEKAIETISEKVTIFIMGLLAPYVKPIIATASNALKTGSGTVVSASAKQQYLVWDDPTSSDPTHSMLSKDHFSNILNEPAGRVAGAILKYVAPRVIYGWDHPEVSEDQIMADVSTVFHHPAARDMNRCELHAKMFHEVEQWASRQNRATLDELLDAEHVRAGRNHKVQDIQSSLGPLEQSLQSMGGTSSHSATAGGPFAMLAGRRGLGDDRDLAYGSNSGTAPSGYEYQGSQQQQQSYGGYDSSQQGSSGYGGSGGYGGGQERYGYGQGEGEGGYGRY